MSHDNIEIVRGVHSDWERGSFTGALELFDPEVVFESFMPDSMERIVAQGQAEVAAFMREFLAQWRDYRIFGDEFEQVGDATVLVSGRQSATGRQSGAAVKSPIFSVWRFRDGKVVLLVFEFDRQSALEAAGVSE